MEKKPIHFLLYISDLFDALLSFDSFKLLMKGQAPSLIAHVCAIGNNRPHNMLMVQLAEKVL